MATIINNDSNPDKVVRVDSSDSSAGWAVAVIILIVLIIAGGYAWAHYHRTAPASGGTNINVTLPGGTSNSGSNSGAAQ